MASLPSDDSPSTPLFTIRFTGRDGLVGWLEAKVKRLSLYGLGSIEVRPTEIVLQGWQRTWLGMPLQSALPIPADSIAHVIQLGARVQFESTSRWRRRRFQFHTQSVQDAEGLAALLLSDQSAGSKKRSLRLQEFSRHLQAVTPRAWITPIIVVVNVAIYVAMVVVARRLGDFDPQHLVAWGSNYGPNTVSGQPWRLVTAVFLHANLLHLVLNMWALWNVGRMAERLFGSWFFLLLYGATGVLGSLASIAWDPSQNSVGASGAIFGIFGAFLAFLASHQSQVPLTIVRAHWVSTLTFVLFSLVSGAFQANIDNAAHFGGLVCGFALGWLLARPVDPVRRRASPRSRSMIAVALATTSIAAGLWYAHGLRSEITIPEQYFLVHNWYVKGEAENLRLWQELAARATSGSISDAEMAR